MCVYSEGGSEVNWFNVATQTCLYFEHCGQFQPCLNLKDTLCKMSAIVSFSQLGWVWLDACYTKAWERDFLRRETHVEKAGKGRRIGWLLKKAPESSWKEQKVMHSYTRHLYQKQSPFKASQALGGHIGNSLRQLFQVQIECSRNESWNPESSWNFETYRVKCLK